MDSINLNSYYDKISQIKARVMSKQRDPRDVSSKYTNQNYTHSRNPSNYSSYSGQYSKGIRDQYQSRAPYERSQQRQPLDTRRERDNNIMNRARDGISREKKIDHYQARNVSEPKKDPSPHVMDRVKELQSVNQKIKQMLANKRQPSVSSIQPRTSNLPKRNEPTNTTPKKMTSLFQNQNSIVESKVGPAANKDRKTFELEEYKAVSKDKEISKRKEEKNNVSVPKREQISFGAESYLTKKTPEKRVAERQDNKKEMSKSPYYSYQIDKKVTIEPYVPPAKGETYAPPPKVEIYAPPPKVQYKTAVQPLPVNEVKYFGKGQSKKLVAKLVHQIELDIKLRESKEKFNCFKSQDKWKIISDKISSYGVHLMESDLQKWLTISKEECDPFIDLAQQTSLDYDELAVRFASAWESWSNQVKESVTIEGLEKEGFKIQEIDMGGKGYLTVEDFVCFINFSSDNFFRNRDVYGMFRRWNNLDPADKLNNRLSYEVFLGFVAK